MTSFDAISQFKRLLNQAEQPFRVTKSLGSNDGQPVLLGLDEIFMHLLIPVAHPEKQDLSGFKFKSLKASIRQIDLIDVWGGSYIDMYATRESFDLSLFAAISDELILGLHSGESVIDQLSTVANKWIRLLSSEEEETANRNQVVGLLGELIVLEALIDAGFPEIGLSSWVGSEKARHDFEFSTLAVEVKSSSTMGQKTAAIHGLEQLSAAKFTRLFLAHFQFEWDPKGLSLKQVSESVKSKLAIEQQGVFEQKLGASGFDEKRLDIASIYTFKLSSNSLFEVDKNFPKITFSLLDSLVQEASRISRVEYVLNLTGLPYRDVSENLGEALVELAAL
jgi:hypothetical protein